MKTATTILLSFMLTISSFAAGLKGTYTIDATKAASSTNYTSFNDADSDLTLGSRSSTTTVNGPGVSGQVIFNIADGVYNETVEFISVTGASAKNNIIFQSASKDSSKVILIDSVGGGSYTTPAFVIHLNNASFFKFNQITIQRGFNSGGGGSYDHVVLWDNVSDSDSITNCRIIGNYTPGSTNYGGLVFSGYNYTTYSYTIDQHNVLYNNYMKDGYYGIYWLGSYTTTGAEKANVIDHNTIDSCGYYAILAQYQENFTITNNKINMPEGNYGVYLYGINASTTGTPKTSMIANNFIDIGPGTGTNAGIYAYNLDRINIVYNNINIYGVTGGGSYALYISPNSGTKAIYLYNNNLINQNTGAGDYALNGNYLTGEDYNNLFTAGTNLVNYNGTNYTSLSAWIKGAKGFAKHDTSVDPIYISNTDLHVGNPSLNNKGKYLSYVTKDIDNDLRSTTTPDIGADEFTPIALKPLISAITNPVSSFCVGVQDVYTTLINIGLDTIKSATIEWSVNGVSQPAYHFSGTIISTSSASIKLGSYNFSSSTTAYNITVQLDTANGIAVTTTPFSISVRSGLTGTFTIDNSGKGTPNYTTFTDAVADLNSKGVCGAVTYNVADGFYSEAITITAFPGSSATNTVTFQSASLDSSKVTLDTAANPCVVYINGGSYITFRKMTINNSSAASGGGSRNDVIDINSGSRNITFENNILHTSPSSSGYVIINNYGTAENNMLLQYNRISGGYAGMQLAGGYTSAPIPETGMVVYHNIIDSCTGYGILAEYEDGLNISKNIFNMSTGYVGIYLYNNAVKSTDTTRITNNFITNLGGSANGLQMYYTDLSNIYFNSVNTNTSSYSAYLYNGTTTANTNNVIDNIFANYGSGGAVYGTLKGMTSSNYNDFYSAGSTLGQWYNPSTGTSTSCSTMAQWRTASGKDKNSISADPLFVSPLTGDLHLAPASVAVVQKGTRLATVPDDFDGQKRSKTPNMGGDETRQFPSDAGIISIDSPAVGFCSGSKDVYAKLFNAGTDTLKSVTISWTVSGTAMASYSWTGTLNPFSSTLINIGSITFAAGSSKLVKVYTTGPNGGVDSNALNDTTSRNIGTGITGTFTIGGTTPDYASFRAAASALKNNGICGPVTFNVRDGSYNESVAIKAVPGSSATNTITFQSASLDSNKVVLDTAWAGAYGSNSYALRLDGASYVNFRKMTISNYPGVSYGYSDAVQFANKASHNTLESNIILADATLYASYGAAVNNDLNGIEAYNTIRYNIISGGEYGISFSGTFTAKKVVETGNVIYANFIDSFWQYGIYAQYQDHINISRNQVFSTNGSFGIYINEATKSDTSFIINNFITIGSSNNYGIYSYNNQLLAVYNNNVNSSSSSTYNYVGYFAGSVLCKVRVFNNIFNNDNSGTTIHGEPNGLTTSDYNDLYSVSGSIGDWYGTSCSTLSDWQSSSKKDKHSVSGDPVFVDPTIGDLHLTSASTVVLGKGLFIHDTRKDIDGDNRNLLTPDIGADESHPINNDIGVTSIVSPVSGTCGSTATVVAVKVKNFGVKDQTTFNVHVVVNGTTSASKAFSGTLRGSGSFAPYDTIVYVTFSPALNTSAGGTFSITAYTDLVADSAKRNDTLNTTISLNFPPVAGFKVANGGACLGSAISVTDTSSSSGTATYTYYLLNTSGSRLASSSAKNPSFTYSTAGSYIISQTVMAGGCSDSTTRKVSVFANPTAKFGPGPACLGATTNFFDSSSAGSGTVSTYSWNLGNTKTASVKNPSTVYSATGLYTITLKVTTSNGCSDSTTRVINVDSVNAKFTHTIPAADGTVSFYANDKTLAGYSWDFGDKSTLGIDSSATHQYLTKGKYVAMLTVTNAMGCTATAGSDSINILNTGIASASTGFKADIYPNPFKENTIIAYTLDKGSNVKVEVYDITGRLVSTLINHAQAAGEYQLNFNNSANPAGIYLIKMTIGDRVITKQVTMVK